MISHHFVEVDELISGSKLKHAFFWVKHRKKIFKAFFAFLILRF